MYENRALAAARQLVDWLEAESYLFWFILEKDEADILKLELRFLITFLKHTADRCSDDYENLEHLLTRIEDVGQHINKLHLFLASLAEEQSRCNSCLSLLKRLVTKHPFPAHVVDAVSLVLHKIELVKPDITQVLMNVSRLSGSSSRMSDELVSEFVDSLLEVLELFLGCNKVADSIQPSLREGFSVLETKLASLKPLLSFTAKRCNEYHKLNELFTHAQAFADAAAYLTYSCLTNEMDEDRASRTMLQLSDLVQRIDRIKPEVPKIFQQVLKGSKSSELKSTTYEPDASVMNRVNSLLQKTSELLLLYPDMIPVKDQLEIIHVMLTCIRYFLKNAERFTKPGKSDNLLAEMEVMVMYAGCVIYSLFEDEVNQEIAMEMRLAVSNLLEQFELLEVQVRKIYLEVPKAQISNLPRTDELGALDLLLRNLKELLNNRVDSIILLKDGIQMVQRDLEFLGSFLTTIAKQRHEHDRLDHLWRQIIHVMYEVEHVVDLVVAKDGNVLHHMLWLFDLMKDIKLLKTEIKEIWIHDENMCRIHKCEPTEIPSDLELSQKNAPQIDGEMVGFKDEEQKLVEQLVRGSNQLRIVSIVGMPGLGKTFLTKKVYNDPIIRDHFHVHAWCNVSQVHEKKQLLITILSQVKSSTGGMSKRTDEELAGELQRCLLGRKYLIVLDDMWDIEAWNDLNRSFPNDKFGSRIVFTSRYSNLALQARSDSKLLQLRRFCESESWELLQKKVFQKESCPLELLEAGQQIAKRCNGLPFTVVVVAGLLARRTKEQEQWREVAMNLSSFIITDPERQYMDILDLSYKSLPDYLKSCFLYLGAFPEDREISTVKLIQLWIAEGFVRKDGPTLEYIAEGYLLDLIDRNLIIASKERSIGGVKACLVHDLVREFCLEKAKEECFLKVIDWSSGNLLNSPTSSSTSYEQRRLFVHIVRNKKFFSNFHGPRVRSLLFFSLTSIPLRSNEVESIICGFKLLRVLDLMAFGWLQYFPSEIVSLVQLRYLAMPGIIHFYRQAPSLRAYRFSCCIPSSIANLWNLETFIVGGELACMSICTILKMINLRHLRIYGISDDDGISDDGPFQGSDDSFQLESLQTLSSPTLSYGAGAEFMRSFPNLKKLHCRFKESWDDSRKCNRLPVLDFLNKLESLKTSYEGKLSHPVEFSLPSTLKKLTLSYFGLQWEHMSIVGKLPNLQVLKLLSDAVEGEEWIMKDEEFPKLKFLKLHLLDVKRWTASEDYFPPIEQLIVSLCTRLEEIPSCLEYISTLNVIKIECYTDSLKAAVNRIQEEQADLGNEELKVEITDETC